MIPYGRQTIDEDDIRAVVDVLRSDWLTQGPKVEEFETALAKTGECRYAVVFSSGSSALQAAYFAANLKAGDEVIASPITFSATTNAALWFGAKAVFADVQPATGQMDPSTIEAVASSKTRILAPTDYAGHPADWDTLMPLAKRRRWIVIEDACHALGARSKGRAIGSLADMTVFSFHPVKSITTGEGGAVLTNDKNIYERMIRFRHHGISKDKLKHAAPGAWYHEMQDLGLNARLTDIQCALGISQLRKLDRFLEARRAVARRYIKAMEGWGDVQIVQPYDKDESAWHLFPILLKGALSERRDQIFNELRDAGIGVQVHYIPVHRHPYYESLGFRAGLCPNAEAFSRHEISLPIYPNLSVQDQDKVIAELEKAVGKTYESSHSR